MIFSSINNKTKILKLCNIFNYFIFTTKLLVHVNLHGFRFLYIYTQPFLFTKKLEGYE
jgi:hypothetical protein